MRTFEIGKKIKRGVRNGYYIEIDYMFGDGDKFIKKKVGPFLKREEEQLNTFLDILDKCISAFPNGKGGFDFYEDEGKVSELKVWMHEYEPYDDEEYDEFDRLCEELSEKDKKVINRIKFNWPTEPAHDTQAEILEYKLLYYKDNVCYKVNINKMEE